MSSDSRIELASRLQAAERENERLRGESSELRSRLAEHEAVVDAPALERTEAEPASEQTRLPVDEDRHRSVLENMAEGLVIFDRGGNITYQNPASVRIHDKRLSDKRARLDQLRVNWRVRTYPDGALVPPDQWAIPRVLRGERVQNERFYVDCIEDPERSFVGIYNGCSVLDSHGEFAHGFLTIQDITEQARAETKLRQANEQLQETDRRKNEFLAMLSHELRNPLAPVKNSVYILEHAAPGGQQAKRAHEVIGRQVAHLTRLIDDLLDVTRISRGKIRLLKERVELGDLVRRTAEDHRSVFKASGIELTVSTCAGPVHVQGDPTRLAQVIGNLLGNSVKFTHRGGLVELRLTRERARALVTVRDNGSGMNPGLLEKLFEPFVQDDATLDRTKGGLGLGLALVRGIVELHGGTVSAHSAGPGQGSELTISLPLDLEPIAVFERASQPSARSTRSVRVLVIEDNGDAAQTLKDALELRGHHVKVAATGLEGLEQARELQPDVVLCDIGLPGIDGYEVARRMRADPALAATRVIALSGYATPEDVDRAKQAGFVEHIAKPPDLGALEAMLTDASVP